LQLDAIGFGSLNLDEFWEVDRTFLLVHGLEPGKEYVRDVAWFINAYPELSRQAVLKAVDPGGSASNMIAAMRRMGFATGFYGVTGEEDAASLMLHELGEPENLNVRMVAAPAGRCLALIDRDDHSKDRALVILPNANDLAAAVVPDSAYFEQARWVHFTSFVSRKPLEAQISLVERLSPEVRISFDPGAVYAPRGLDELKPILSRTSVLFVAVEELRALSGLSGVQEGAGLMLATGVTTVVVKKGAEGIEAFQADRSIHQPAIPPGEIKDRTGAGDVAAAGFVAGIIRSLPLEKSLEWAALAASRSIEGYGRSCYPEAALWESFLSTRRNSHP
jgi:ribokinase